MPIRQQWLSDDFQEPFASLLQPFLFFFVKMLGGQVRELSLIASWPLAFINIYFS